MRFLGTFAVAAACCYLAYLTAVLLVWRSPPALLAIFTGVEFYGFQPHWALPNFATRFPGNGGPVLYALYHGGFVFTAVAAILVAVASMSRSRGWARLFWVYVVLWSGSFLALLVALLVGWRLGPLRGALGSLLPPGFDSTAWRIGIGILIAAPLLCATHFVIRRLLDGADSSPVARLAALAHWLLLPLAACSWFLSSMLFRHWGPFRLGLLWVPLLLVALAGLPAALRRSRPAAPFDPGWRGAAALLSVLGLTLGGLFGYQDLARSFRRAEFAERRSNFWILHFDAAAGSMGRGSQLAAAADRRLGAAAARLGLPPHHSRLNAYFYASTEAKQKLAGDINPFTLNPRRLEVHNLLAADGDISDPRGEPLLLMQCSWGGPGSEAVARTLARYAVGNFHGVPLSQYAARITQEEGAYTLRDIFHLDSDSLSPLVSDALGGAWVENLVEQRGKQDLAALYRVKLSSGTERDFARALGASWEELEREWGNFQLENARRYPPPGPHPRPASFFHRGISFSHEVGGSGSWGYGSDRARQQLVEIRNLPANAIAVVPYAFTRAPREIYINANTDERDDRVIRTIQAARQLGLSTTLKPQLWASGFTGDMVFARQGDFDRWFALYRRWLLHYARMAELYDVDLLVVGNELGGLTGQEAPWRGLIADLRRVYSGPLTYAASWGAEFEKLGFWDALDYIGVNMYYPLAEPGQEPRPDSPRVRELVDRLATVSQKCHRPVLFTEVGYPARATAAVRPWETNDAPLNPELQKRCYSTVFEAFYGRPWFAGLYWWKWPSSGDAGSYDGSFSPLGKPARQVLAAWYSRPPGAASPSGAGGTLSSK